MQEEGWDTLNMHLHELRGEVISPGPAQQPVAGLSAAGAADPRIKTQQEQPAAVPQLPLAISSLPPALPIGVAVSTYGGVNLSDSFDAAAPAEVGSCRRPGPEGP